MLSLKNPFAKSTTSAESSGPSATNTMDALARIERAEGLAKHKEMFLGKAQAQVKRCRAQGEDDRNSLEHAKHALLGDEVDLGAAMKAVKHAEDRLHESDMLLTAAIAKEETAQVEFTNAKRLVLIEKEAAQAARVLTLGPEGEALLEAVKQFSRKVFRETEDWRVIGGSEKCIGGAIKIRDEWKFQLELAVLELAVTGAPFPNGLKHYPDPGFTNCLEVICSKGRRV